MTPMLPIPWLNIASHCLQDECQRKVRKLNVEETGKTLKVQAGWYTERQMKDTLGWPKLATQNDVSYHPMSKQPKRNGISISFLSNPATPS